MMNERSGPVAANGLRAAARTDTGRQRDHNEDRFFLDLDRGIFLVVDGVGGHAAGEIAARIAQETILKRLERQDASADVRVREAITLANQQILLQAGDAPERKGMACVLTLAVLEGRRLTVGHVGDTRLYRLSPNGIAKMTHDHSPVGEREDAREISETEAMQHARRNEVYRDVGSEPRDPEAPDFIETLVTSLDDDSALLLCSDGLSDMLPSVQINRIVRANAGQPARVVDALVDAANQAGGKDNITVVYVEAPAFAKTHRASRVLPASQPNAQQVPTEEIVAAGAPQELSAPAASKPSAPWLQSGMVLFGLGLLAGIAGLYAFDQFVLGKLAGAESRPRALVVGGGGAGSFGTIGDALLQARDGDVVRVEPGTYPEAVEIRRAVSLIATQPHAAVLVAPQGTKAWASISVWSSTSVVRGFRISNHGTAGHVGVRMYGGDLEIDDVVVDGPLEVGVDIAGEGGRATVRGSRFLGVTGVPVRISDRNSVTLRQNLFRAPAGAAGPAVISATDAGLSLDANVFMHFSRAPVALASGRAFAIDPVCIIPPPAAPPAGARRSR